jgi:predicted small lipoprotein YifL
MITRRNGMNILSLAPRSLRLTLFCTLLLILVALTGCGRKGPVRPQLAALPAAPGELRIDQQGIDFLLSWTLPAYNQDASPADDLAAFRIYRLIFNAAEGCPTCRDPEQLVATIALNRPAPAVRLGKRLYWRDAAVAPGTGHAYLVVPVTIGGQAGESAGTHRSWQSPPPPPRELHAELVDGAVRLSWAAPPELAEGEELLGFNLYRRAAGNPYPPVALNVTPLRATQLTDLAAEAGREALYRITTVVRSGDLVLESVPAAEVTATPAGAR